MGGGSKGDRRSSFWGRKKLEGREIAVLSLKPHNQTPQGSPPRRPKAAQDSSSCRRIPPASELSHQDRSPHRPLGPSLYNAIGCKPLSLTRLETKSQPGGHAPSDLGPAHGKGKERHRETRPKASLTRAL